MKKRIGIFCVVYKTNRFFRDTKRGSYYKCIYSAYGIDVESATQHYGEGKSAALMKNIDACMDEYFSVELPLLKYNEETFLQRLIKASLPTTCWNTCKTRSTK